MAFRGRGRGRGGFGQGSVRFAKEEKYEIFPEIKEYPDVNLKQAEEFRKLILMESALKKFWASSAYHLGSSGLDSEKYMKLTDEYVPAELVAKNVKRSHKKVRWDPQSDLQRLDLFEKLDQGSQGQDDEKEKKEDEDDEDNENIEDEEDESGDDYDQNIDFDDDEDDFNMHDDHGDDEGIY
ncbi:hypothetical protein M8C21_030046 [Ambrosia artemisiifolia]|uniref:DNA-directed RNA polymerase III subunit n=1 Tax=Ambrosia artemisiifolia TaxID=4212 RepID=A0AAD5CJK9_AMBAR|nr:hypothetical protein M8C21_030046 [Ambrosia artemisiifolia]